MEEGERGGGEKGGGERGGGEKGEGERRVKGEIAYYNTTTVAESRQRKNTDMVYIYLCGSIIQVYIDSATRRGRTTGAVSI